MTLIFECQAYNDNKRRHSNIARNCESKLDHARQNGIKKETNLTILIFILLIRIEKTELFCRKRSFVLIIIITMFSQSEM